MYQKRRDRARSKKAQITIFITAGIIILLVFVLLLQLAMDIQKKQLVLNQKDIFDKIFTKDALKLFVDECLREGMEEGLTLIGRQGRLWTDQLGGRVLFEPGKTGVEAEGDRIFYALKDEEYSTLKNAFPCNDDNNPTAFCQYTFPNTRVGFGEVKLDRRFVAADLQRYLREHTIKCVEDFIKSEITDAAKVETSPDMNLKVNLQPDVISVDVHYPLRLKSGKEEFFHISDFGFTYPSQFSQLIDSVVAFALEQDQKYIDFNLNQQTLTQPTFSFESEVITPGFCQSDGTCTISTRAAHHAALSTRTEIKEISTGDDLITFTVPKVNIIPGTAGDFIFRVLRENRPPALDYVGRLECPLGGYDYLVIKGNKQVGNIDIDLSAKDADEDDNDITYSFTLSGSNPGSLPNLPVQNGKYMVDSGVIKSNSVLSGIYTLEAKAPDNNQVKSKDDWQDVKIFIDNPLTTDILLNSPSDYGPFNVGGSTGPVNLDTTTGVYRVSREDPFELSVSYPSASGALNRQKKINLKYSSSRGNKFNFDFPVGQTTDCFLLPFDTGVINNQGGFTLNRCAPSPPSTTALDYYNNFMISWDFPDQIQAPFSYSRTESGKFSLSATGLYCQSDTIFSTSESQVEIKGCYPLKNPDHPYAYPDHQLMSDDPVTGQPRPSQPINPLLANHTCCSGTSNSPDTWQIKPQGTECFRNPVKGCYGGIRNFPGFISGYILTTEVKVCDGLRGNVCLGGREAKLPPGPMHCGMNSDFACSGIHINCEDQDSFSFVDLDNDPLNGGNGWCHGKIGCQNFCTGSGGVVFRQPPTRAAFSTGPSPRRDFSSAYINQQATNNQVTDENNNLFSSTFNFKCGCGSNNENDDGKFCDSNYDGYFDGTCSRRVCQPPASPRPAPPPSPPPSQCTLSDFTCTPYGPTPCPASGKQSRTCTLQSNANCINPGAVDLAPIQICTPSSVDCQIGQNPDLDNCDCPSPLEVDLNGICNTKSCNPGDNTIVDQCICFPPLNKDPSTGDCNIFDPLSGGKKP